MLLAEMEALKHGLRLFKGPGSNSKCTVLQKEWLHGKPLHASDG